MTTLMSCSISRMPMPCSLRIDRKQLVELVGFARIEAGGGFVEAEEHGLGAHGAGDLEPALCAIGEVAGGIIGAVDQADLVEPVLRNFDRLSLGAAIGGASRRCRQR